MSDCCWQSSRKGLQRECTRVTRIEREVEGERDRGTARKRTIETRACDSVEWICILPCRFGKRLIIKHIMGDSILYNTQGCTYISTNTCLSICLSVCLSLCVCVCFCLFAIFEFCSCLAHLVLLFYFVAASKYFQQSWFACLNTFFNGSPFPFLLFLSFI